MDIKFRHGSEDLSEKLMEQARMKLTKLTRFMAERTDEALVYVDIERESGSRNSENMWRTSVSFDYAGTSFNAVGNGATPEEATNLSIKELKREISKMKGRKASLLRRGHDILKDLRRSEV